MARSFVVVAFLVFVLCFSSVLARKEPGVEPSAVGPLKKFPLKAPLAGPKAPLKAPPKAPLDGPKAPVKAPFAGPKAQPKAPLAGPKAPLAGPKAPLVGPKALVKAPLARSKAPVKAPLAGSKTLVNAPLAGPKAPRKAPLVGPNAPFKAPLAGPKAPLKAPLAGSKAPSAGPFTVVGKIYCDPCRFEFMSRLSTPLEGVKVNLECRKADSNKATYVKEGKTDANGVYKILVDGDHEDEICEGKPEPKGKGKCTGPMTNKSDRIVLTNNMGSSSLIRLVNPLGFKTKAVDGQCRKVVRELGLDKLEA